MTMKEAYLKLLAENDTALACVIAMTCIYQEKVLREYKEHIKLMKEVLYKEIPLDVIQELFPNDNPNEKGGGINGMHVHGM